MNYLRRASLMSLLAVGLMLVFVACKGDTGPMGPAGAKGDKGDPGDPGPGTRTVVTGSVNSDQGYVEVPLPGVEFPDVALVTVFVQLNDGEWDELPTTWEVCTNPPTCSEFETVFGYATLVDYSDAEPAQDNAVGLLNCNGLEYLIIIIE